MIKPLRGPQIQEESRLLGALVGALRSSVHSVGAPIFRSKSVIGLAGPRDDIYCVWRGFHHLLSEDRSRLLGDACRQANQVSEDRQTLFFAYTPREELFQRPVFHREEAMLGDTRFRERLGDEIEIGVCSHPNTFMAVASIAHDENGQWWVLITPMAHPAQRVSADLVNVFLETEAEARTYARSLIVGEDAFPDEFHVEPAS